MGLGNVLKDDGHLQLERREYEELVKSGAGRYIRKIVGSTEFIRGIHRYCLYLKEYDSSNPLIENKLEKVSEYRSQSKAPALRGLAKTPHLFYFHQPAGEKYTIVVPRVTSENREYLPVGFLGEGVLLSLIHI